MKFGLDRSVKLTPRLHSGMFRFARAKTTQDVFSDLLDVRVAVTENPGPVRGCGGKHDAVVGVDPHRSRPPARKTFGILRPFRTKPPGPEDDEILRRTIVMARNRKTLLVRPIGNRCAVTFVANERVIHSKGVAVAQPGPLEDPVFGMLYPVADGFALTPPLTAAITMADASQAVFRINIEPLVSLLVIAGKLGLVASKGGAALHQVNPPPAGIAAEKATFPPFSTKASTLRRICSLQYSS